MKCHTYIRAFILMPVILISSGILNAQMVRFVVNVDKSFNAGGQPDLNIKNGLMLFKSGDTDIKRKLTDFSGCIPITAKENIPVIIRTGMITAKADSNMRMVSRYINNGSECPDNAKQLYEVSSPFTDGEAVFHLHAFNTPVRSIPEVENQLWSYLAFLGYRTPGSWMKADDIINHESDTGIEFTIEIEYL